MLFNSIEYFVFFPVVVILFFNLPQKYRWILLLLSSCYFYMALVPKYIIILFTVTVVDYYSAILIESSEDNKIRKRYLVASILINIGFLAFFKYSNFLNVNVHFLASVIGWDYPLKLLNIALPIGLSFHTFQSMSYTFEVYRREQKAERHFGYYSLYVMFFPQLVAGPIERAKNLIHQLYEEHYFDYKRITDGLKLMLWGLFKKVVIADRLAVLVGLVYGDPTQHTGWSLILATVFFAFQIYCDFSGYTDIAIGSAQVMGIKLMDNFNRPYFSRSISEFWKRWHISLSSWFKENLYIPLGGNRVSKNKLYLNLLIVFLVSGLWHGASWTYVLWGGLHGLYLIIEIIIGPTKNRIIEFANLLRFPRLVSFFEILTTFILVNVGWVFFRANDVSDAFYILSHFFKGLSLDFTDIFTLFGRKRLLAAFGVILFMELVHLVQEHRSIRKFLDDKPVLLRWATYIILAVSIIFLGQSSDQFIYFQF